MHPLSGSACEHGRRMERSAGNGSCAGTNMGANPFVRNILRYTEFTAPTVEKDSPLCQTARPFTPALTAPIRFTCLEERSTQYVE